MIDNAHESRAVYRHSGKVNWLMFLPGLVATAAVAIAMAGCLFWAYTEGYYWLIFAPMAAAFPVIGAWYLVLKWSHCRNRSVAAVTSVILAVLFYLGYYHVGVIEVVGVKSAHRIDLLPSFIQYRMKTDVVTDLHPPAPVPARPEAPSIFRQAINWCFFGAELAFVIVLFVSIGQRGTSKAFCESCGRWTNSETLKLQPGAAAEFWDALQAGNHRDVQDRLMSTTGMKGIVGTLTVELCPTCLAGGRSPLVCLTVSDVASAGRQGSPRPLAGPRFNLMNHPGVRTFVDHVVLRPDEIGALSLSFPGLASTMAANPYLFAEARSAAAKFRRAQPAPVLEPTKKIARIKTVDSRDVTSVLTRRNAMIRMLIGIASFCAGLIAALAPIGVVYFLEPRPPDWVFAAAVCWMILVVVVAMIWFLYFQTYLPDRFMLGQTWHAIDCREVRAVDLQSPDLFFVDIVPRSNWDKELKEKATDIGLLELNRARRELIFEGDRERYWIPADAILETRREIWAEPNQHQLPPTLHHLVVVRATTAEGPWETCFYRRHTKFRMRTEKERLADALELETRIR
jgi:hypothetical protein